MVLINEAQDSQNGDALPLELVSGSVSEQTAAATLDNSAANILIHNPPVSLLESVEPTRNKSRGLNEVLAAQQIITASCYGRATYRGGYYQLRPPRPPLLPPLPPERRS